MNSYAGETKGMYFLIEDDDLLKTYSDTCNKVSNSIKKEFYSEPIYNNRLLKPHQNLSVMRLHIFLIKKCQK